MASVSVSLKEFKKLERKVNQLIVFYEPDKTLTARESRLIKEAKKDIGASRADKFVNINRL